MAAFLRAILMISSLTHINAMIAYDCAGKNMNITTLSLLGTKSCPIYKTQNITDYVDIQVLQEREQYNVHVYTCLIELDYHVTHCGMHSHSSEVANGYGTLVQELTPEECKDIHRTQVATVYGHKITGVRRNNTLTTTITLSGWSSQDAKCEGGVLNLGTYSWKDVYGTAVARITITDKTGVHRVADDKVVLPNGVSCKYTDGFCLDTHEGYVTWTNVVKERCSQTSYLALYRGKATKAVIKSSLSSHDAFTLYTIKDGKFLATLTQKAPMQICGMMMYTKEHPKLLVQEIKGGNPYFKQDSLSPGNMDIFLYVNAKITHLEGHLRREMNSLYENILLEQCETKTAVLNTQLSMAAIDPVEFAYTYMQKPGYTGIVMGEQIHLIKCNPVYVSARKTPECFNELPVNYTGLPMFMSPRSHILQKTGTPVACSVLMQPAFRLSDTWFVSQNGLSKTSTPASLSPVVSSRWEYTDAGQLATEGIYTLDDLDKLRNQLMYPSERKAITQTVSAVINQDTYISDTSIFSHLITKETVESSFKSFMDNTWSGFLTFGNLFSGIFGVMLIAKILKWTFDTIIHSKGLYEVYGCGWHILGASWDAVTTYLLSPAKVNKYYAKVSSEMNQTRSNEDAVDVHKVLSDQPAISGNGRLPMALYPTVSDHVDIQMPTAPKHNLLPPRV